MNLTAYFDYSDPENQMGLFRSTEILKENAMKDVNGIYHLIGFMEDWQFRIDFSRGFDEIERLRYLSNMENAEKNKSITNEEINLFFDNKRN